MRAFQSSSVSGAGTVPKLVLSSSARAIATSTSHALRPSSCAMSPITRPRYCSFSGATTSWILRLLQFASIRMGFLSLRDCSSSFASAASSSKNASFSSMGSPMTSSQPGGVEDEPRAERQVHREAHRHRERDTRPPCSRA
jgi:hypothetical protein